MTTPMGTQSESSVGPATQTGTKVGSKRPADIPPKLQELRDLMADAPEVGRTALENVLRELTSQVSITPPPPVVSAGRAGSRLGKVSELTLIVPLAPGGAKRLRAFLQLTGGNLKGADDVGTVHDMRFVFLDNDTKMLFATAYDGDWDAYIDDFATKIPDYLDIIDSAWEGWPGIRSPQAKDYLAKYQVTAEGWYVANDLTVAETRRLRRIGEAVEKFLVEVSALPTLRKSHGLAHSDCGGEIFGARPDDGLARNPGDRSEAAAGAVFWHARALPHRRCSGGPRFPPPPDTARRFRRGLVERSECLAGGGNQLCRPRGAWAFRRVAAKFS